MIESLLSRKVEKRPSQVQLKGRILFLAEDPALVRSQLDGTDLDTGEHSGAAQRHLDR